MEADDNKKKQGAVAALPSLLSMAPSAPPLTGPPPPRALPAYGPAPIPVKDEQGRRIPTNQYLFEKWAKDGADVKQPLPPPPHMELSLIHI